MIKHIVMWQVAGESAAEKLASASNIKVGFEALAGKIPGLLDVEVGVNFSKNAEAYDVVLLTSFTDREALKGYRSHPEHLALRDKLAGMRLGRVEVDFEA